MHCRTFCYLMLTMAWLGGLAGCDTRPKIVMPTTVPPIPKNLGRGGGPAQPVMPDAKEQAPATPKE
jgi:hypothetical protein